LLRDLNRDAQPALALRRQAALTGAVVLLLSVGLLVLSQIGFHYGDEGFHLLAARLINAGRRPYLDFFYPQTPLYAYLNAAWMRMLGENWRSSHALSALLTGATIAMLAGYAFSRWRKAGQPLGAALSVAVLIGLNLTVIRFGTISQPYGACLFLSTGAYLAMVRAVGLPGAGFAAWSGLCASAAAACSLLSAPVAPILLLWLMRNNRTGRLSAKCTWFVTAAAVPFLPVAWAAAHGPRQALFNVVEYHLFYRRLGYVKESVAWTNLRVLTGWLDSPQALLLVLLTLLGVFARPGVEKWEQRLRAELRLCGWLIAGLAIYLSSPTPTQPQYFVLLVPFAALLATQGIQTLASRATLSRGESWLGLVLLGIYGLGLARSAYLQRRSFEPTWLEIETVAAEVNRVTPQGEPIYTGEATYFVAKRWPPEGLEHTDALKLPTTPGLARSLRLLTAAEVDNWLVTGRFATVVLWTEDPRIEILGLRHLYRQTKRVGILTIFCNRITAGRPPPTQ
jgi:hypothetical protein